MAAISPTRLVCETPSTTHCSACKDIYYCSRECQRADWKIHKLVCKLFAGFDKSTRPSTNHYLALLFPEQEEEPKLVWCEENEAMAHIGSTVTDDRPGLEQTGVYYNDELGREIKESVQICYRHEFVYDGSRPNVGITKMQNCEKVFWKGPVLVYAITELDEDEFFEWRDFTAGDHRHVHDWFRGYASAQEQFAQLYSRERLQSLFQYRQVPQDD